MLNLDATGAQSQKMAIFKKVFFLKKSGYTHQEMAKQCLNTVTIWKSQDWFI